jgi:hypothetical protein
MKFLIGLWAAFNRTKTYFSQQDHLELKTALLPSEWQKLMI